MANFFKTPGNIYNLGTSTVGKAIPFDIGKEFSSLREKFGILNEAAGMGAALLYGNNKNWEMPVFLKAAGEPHLWRLGLNPTISITGKNKITKRSVAKSNYRGGTIKERFAVEDYTISIGGTLTNVDGKSDVYPYADVNKLRFYFESKSSILIFCPLLDILNIHNIVIESLSLPATKFPHSQDYTITASSDYSFKLLISDDKKSKIEEKVEKFATNVQNEISKITKKISI